MNFTYRTFRRIVLLPLLLLASQTPPLFGQVAVLSSFEGIAVATGDRTDTSRLTDLGVVSVEGASAFVVTLAGELRGRADRDGVIGLLLVPELPFFTSLYRNRKLVLSAAEFTAPVAAGTSSYFMSPSKHAEAGFPAYHLFLFNTTGAPATVNVYVYPIRRN
jgi:hypothetical protein